MCIRDSTYRAVRANMKLNAKVTNWFEIGANVNFQDRTDGSIDMDEGQFMRNSCLLYTSQSISFVSILRI